MNNESGSDDQLDNQLKRLQIANLQADLKLKDPFWTRLNPIIIAAVITAIFSIAASYVSLTSAREQRLLDKEQGWSKLNYEFVKSEYEFVLQALHAANPDEAAENLKFLLDAGILQRDESKIPLNKFLKDRQPNKGPFFRNNTK
jgi:hypothetical protein